MGFEPPNVEQAALERLFSDETVSRISSYPAVRQVVLELLAADMIAAARLLALIVSVAEHRGEEVAALRRELGLRASDAFGRIAPD